MRIVLLILSALLSLSVLAPLSASASVGDPAMAMMASNAPNESACPDDCCQDCPDFTQCQLGCAVAVLPEVQADALPTRFTPTKGSPTTLYRSAKLPPATPPPRVAAQL